jgi:riboflavin kinase/FMN adenylyltransferase
MNNTIPIDRRTGVKVIDWGIGDNALGRDGFSGLAAAIGNFDGVHLGHQQLIGAAVDGAKEQGLEAAVVTFSPHPRRFFAPEGEGFALADDDDKISFLAELGVSCIIRLKFNDAMQNTSAEDFVNVVLPSLGVKTLYAGADFAFGKGRCGRIAMIAGLKAESGITVHALPLIEVGGMAISSSSIRGMIASGAMGAAAELLGRPYVISGVVIKGDQRGRVIGFPTANMRLGQMTIPAFGVYTVKVRLAHHPNTPIYDGIANIGLRPTVNDLGLLLEANLFDYDGDLYGMRLNILLLDFIRPEKTFESLDHLKEQIARDIDIAHAYHDGQYRKN